MGIDEEIYDAVQEHGWQLISISDIDPPFVYSIGMMPDHAELIIFGLPAKTCSSILNAIAGRIKHGEVFEKGIYEIESPHKRIGIRQVHSTQIPLHFGYAMGFCRLTNCGDCRAIQVFWPDKSGRFPFDVGCELKVYGLQPRLDIGLSPREVAEWERQWE